MSVSPIFVDLIQFAPIILVPILAAVFQVTRD